MNNKIKMALAAAALLTATTAMAGPHHWGNWGAPDCPYAAAGELGFEPGVGPNCPRGFDGMGSHGFHGMGPHARGIGPHAIGMGFGAGLESPYMANLIEQAGLTQDYEKVLKFKDDAFAKRQVLVALKNNSTNVSEIEKAAQDFTAARRAFKEARWILFDKLSAKYPQGWPTMQSQAAMPK